jgi:hypothetical protein
MKLKDLSLLSKYAIGLRIYENKKFFGILDITCRCCGRKSRKNLRKKLGQYQDYFLKIPEFYFLFPPQHHATVTQIKE